MPRKAKPAPRDHLEDGTGDWPWGKLIRAESAPVPLEATLSAAQQAMTLCVRLRTIMQRSKPRLTVTALAEEAGASRQAIYSVLNGRTWPDLITIHRLEVAVQDQLWVNEAIPQEIQGTKPRHFRRRDREYSIIGFVDLDDWEMVVSPVNRADGWRWELTRLTDEGWTRDENGTAEDPEAAEQAAEQRIAERIAAEAPPPDEQ